MSGSSRVILLGVDSSLAEAVLRLIEERDIELDRVYAVAPAEIEAECSFRGEPVLAEPLEGFAWRAGDRVLATGRAAWVARQFEPIRAAGGHVLAVGEAGLAGAYAQAASRFMTALAGAGNLDLASLVAMLPVSLAGQAGVDELAGQTRALFAMDTVEPEVFPLRIAFNLIPVAGARGEAGLGGFEQALAGALRELHGDCVTMVSALWCPVFYGGALSLHVRLDRPVDLAGLRQRIATTPGLTLFDVDLPGGVPTPASDAQDSDSVFVGRLQETDAHACSAWLVFDVDRLEAAAMLDALEIMIEKKAI